MYDKIRASTSTRSFAVVPVSTQDGRVAAKVYDNGGEVVQVVWPDSPLAPSPSPTSYMNIGNRNSTMDPRGVNCAIYAIRMYSRTLSDEEIARNYQVDKVRFGLK